jgi:hypothetical protein
MALSERRLAARRGHDHRRRTGRAADDRGARHSAHAQDRGSQGPRPRMDRQRSRGAWKSAAPKCSGPISPASQIEFFHALILPATRPRSRRWCSTTRRCSTRVRLAGVRNVGRQVEGLFQRRRARARRTRVLHRQHGPRPVRDRRRHQQVRRRRRQGLAGYGYSWLLGTDGTLAA